MTAAGFKMPDGSIVHVAEWLPLYQQARTGEPVVLQHGAREAVITAVLVHTTPDYRPPSSEDRWMGRPALDRFGALWEQTGERQRPVGNVEVLMDAFHRLTILEETNGTHIYDTAELVQHLRKKLVEDPSSTATKMWATAIRAAAGAWAAYHQAVLKPYELVPPAHIKAGEQLVFTHRELSPYGAPPDHVPFTHSKQLMLTLIGIAKYDV